MKLHAQNFHPTIFTNEKRTNCLHTHSHCEIESNKSTNEQKKKMRRKMCKNFPIQMNEWKKENQIVEL